MDKLTTAKLIIGVITGIFAFKWGAWVEKRNLSTRWRIVSFSLLVIFAAVVGIYIFYF